MAPDPTCRGSERTDNGLPNHSLVVGDPGLEPPSAPWESAHSCDDNASSERMLMPGYMPIRSDHDQRSAPFLGSRATRAQLYSSLDMVPYREDLLLAGQADPGTSTHSRSSRAWRLRSPRDAHGCDSAAAADGRLGRLVQAHNQAGTSDAWQLGARCFVRVLAMQQWPGAGCPVLSHRQRNLARHPTRGHNRRT